MKRKHGIEYHPPTVISWKDEGYFTTHGVVYQGETRTYALFEKLTCPMNLERLSEFHETEKQKGNPVPANSEWIFSIMSGAYDSRTENPDAERLRVFLQQSCRRSINTFTCVDYNPPGEKDRIIHNPDTSDKFYTDGEFVGSNDWFSNITDRDILIPLLGTNDVRRIDKVFQWINKTRGYLWRKNLNSKGKTERRSVGFVASGYRLYLCCDRYPLEVPAFRVIALEKSE